MRMSVRALQRLGKLINLGHQDILNIAQLDCYRRPLSCNLIVKNVTVYLWTPVDYFCQMDFSVTVLS